MGKRGRRRIRRRAWSLRILGGLLLLLACSLFFYEPILKWSVRKAVATLCPGLDVRCASVAFKDGGIALHSVRAHSAQLSLEAPSAHVMFLLSSGEMTLTIEQATATVGSLCIPLSLRLKVGQEGRLQLLNEHSECTFRKKKGGWHIDLHLQDAPLAAALLSLPYPELQGVQAKEGVLHLFLQGELDDQLGLLSAHAKGSVHNAKVCGYGCQALLEKGEFAVAFLGSGAPLALEVALEGGECTHRSLFGDRLWELNELRGSIKDYEGVFTADLIRDERGGSVRIACKKGDAGGVFAELFFDEQVSPCVRAQIAQGEARISFCDCDAFLLDGAREALSLRLPQLEEWELTEGVANGKLTLSSHGQVELEGFSGRTLSLQNERAHWYLFLKGCSARGIVQESEAGVKSFKVRVEEAEADHILASGEIWNFSNIWGSCCLFDHKVEQASLRGSFLGLNGEVEVTGPYLWSDTRFSFQGTLDQLASLISDDLALSYQEMEEVPSEITGRVCQAHGEENTSLFADLLLGKQKHPLHFDATLREGALRSLTFKAAPLPHALLSPLIDTLCPHLQPIQGVGIDGHANEDLLEISQQNTSNKQFKRIAHAASWRYEPVDSFPSPPSDP